MQNLEVELPAGIDFRLVDGIVEKTCKARGLGVMVKTSLSSYPGSIHWHFHRGAERGTLEVTCWEEEGGSGSRSTPTVRAPGRLPR